MRLILCQLIERGIYVYMSRYTYVTQEVKKVEDRKTDSQKMKDLFLKSLIKFYFIVIQSSSKAESMINQNNFGFPSFSNPTFKS